MFVYIYSLFYILFLLARRCIYRYGLVTPVRVCAQCADSIDETHRMDAIIWRDLRVSAYLRNRLIPYFNPAVDRGIDKVFRYCSLLETGSHKCYG